MKIIILISLICAATYALPLGGDNPAEATILRFDNERNPDGSYQFAYETSDGSKREEKAEIVNAGSENESLVVRGSYSYIGPDGVTYTVTYIADENGFQPIGDHIPSRGAPAPGQ